MGSKFWSEHFFDKKLMLFGDGAPKKWPKTKVVRFWWNLVPRGFRGCWFQKSHPFSRVIIIWRSIVGFLGAPSPPPKIVEIESLSDFDEIWWMLVFDDANFKHRIHFSVVIVWEYILSLCVSYKCVVGGATQLPMFYYIFVLCEFLLKFQHVILMGYRLWLLGLGYIRLASEASSRPCLPINNWFTVLREALDDYVGVCDRYEICQRQNLRRGRVFPLLGSYFGSIWFSDFLLAKSGFRSDLCLFYLFSLF